MKKRELNQLSIIGGICFVLGVLFALNSIDGFLGLTGNVITDKAYASLGSFFGIFFFLAGILIFVSERLASSSGLQTMVKTEKIGNLVYDSHALERMKKRGLFPTIVASAIESGDHYRLRNTHNFGEAKGATQAYVARHSASIVPGEGGVGGRMITIEQGKKKEYQNVVVLTNDSGIVKTSYMARDKELKSFFDRYINPKK
jgi:hypothetical protein